MFWSSPPVPSKQASSDDVQVPPVSGSPATSAPSLSPVVSAAPTVFRWSVQTAPIVSPCAAYQIALTRPLEAASHGKNWCPVAAGASSFGTDQEAPASVENTYSIWPWPDGCSAWNAMTSVPFVLSAVRYGPARSKRGNVCPVGQLKGLSPHSRAPLPENWLEMNAGYVTTSRALLNVLPLSVDAANAAPLTEPGAWANAPPVPPCQPTD